MRRERKEPKAEDSTAKTRDVSITNGLPSLHPLKILREAIAAVPAVKYALGVAGIVAVVAIVSSFRIDLRIAAFGTVITFVLMVALVVFAKLSTTASRHYVAPVLVLMWSFLALTIATALLLFTSVFFRVPVDLQDWLRPRTSVTILESLRNTAAAEVLTIAYLGAPPPAPTLTSSPKLQFEILAKRKGTPAFIPLKDGDSLASEVDDYVFVARPLSPGYLYVFQLDSAGRMEWLFPTNASSKFSSGANPLASDQTLQMPSADSARGFYLDTTLGVEHVYAVLATARWPELEEALAKQSMSRSAAASAIAIQQPNGLRLRGVGGVRTHGVPAPASVERVFEGKMYSLPLDALPLEASSAVLVTEHWFRHVAP